MNRNKPTKETKFAEIVSNHIADLRFDLEFAGRYLGMTLSNLSYRRLVIILEAMKHEREQEKNDYNYDRE
jgi:hypothetical protein